MKGQVTGVRHYRVAVLLDLGVTVADIIGKHDVGVGDILSGELDSLGPVELVNETKRCRVDAYIEDTGCSPKAAEGMLEDAAF